MPYDIRVEPLGFWIEITKDISFDDIAIANDALMEFEIWQEHKYQVWSFLNAYALQGDKRDSRVISKVDEASMKRSHINTIKIAFVSKNAKTNEVLEAYIDSVDPNMVIGKIFTSEAEARAWVSV